MIKSAILQVEAMLRVQERENGYRILVAPPGRRRAAVVAALLMLSAARAAAEEPREQPACQPVSVPCSMPATRSALADAVERLHAALRLPDGSGVQFSFRSILEGFKNFRGGIRTAPAVGAPTLDLNFTLDTQELWSWPGGKFNAELEYHGGQNPSEVLVGDLQAFDKLNFRPYFQFVRVWYRQRLFADSLSIKLGKMDANDDFGIIDYALPFLNTSSQYNTSMLFVFPTKPESMPGLNVFLTPSEAYYLAFGAYYSNSSVNFANFTGDPQLAFANKYGAFLITETGLKWKHDPLLNRAGNFKLGGWAQTGKFPRLAGSRRHSFSTGPVRPSEYVRSRIKRPHSSHGQSDQSSNSQHQQHGTGGYYLVFDQTLWQPADAQPDGRGVRCFLSYGGSQGSVSTIDQQASGGFTWTGLFPSRPQDILGFAPFYAGVSDQAGLPHSYELAFETFYRVQMTPWAYVQPDLQYIINPGGQYPDAFVLTVRLVMNFE
jgi:porin